jgi:uroporphyrinogen-III synthase
MPMTGRLAGRSVVVTRAAEQAGRLVALLEAEGAVVIEVPTVVIVDPDDGGRALAAAAGRIADFDWVVVTSPNGAARLAAAIHQDPARQSTGPAPRSWRLAVIGPGTAEACATLGLEVDLIPERFVAEGLLASFPPAPPGGGRVLLAQAEGARPVLAAGVARRGWSVEAVSAYRTVSAPVPLALLDRVAMADAITFTSGSTARSFVGAIPGGQASAVSTAAVVCIGPVTAGEAEAVGLKVAAVADPHDLHGLVEAVVRALQ